MKIKMFNGHLQLSPEGADSAGSTSGNAAGGDGKQAGESSSSQNANKGTDAKSQPSTMAEAIQAAVKQVTGATSTEENEGAESGVLLSNATGEGKGQQGEGEQEAAAGEKGEKEEGQTEGEGEENEDGEGKEGEGDEKKEEGTEEGAEVDYEKNPPPFHTHPAWKATQEKVKSLKAEVEQVKPLAEAQQSITSFCEEHQVTPEMFQEGLTVLAALNSDPFRARQLLEPIYQNLLKVTGVELPDDLAAKVKSGSLSEEDAREIAELRGRKAVDQARGKLTEKQQQQKLMQDSQVAVAGWAKAKATTDLGYARKEQLIVDRFMVLQSSTPITSPQQAVALFEQAYKDVSKQLSNFIPKPTATKPSLASLGSKNNKTNGTKAPATMQEAVKQAADKYKA